CGACCPRCWCAPVRPPVRPEDAAQGWHPHPSLQRACLCSRSSCAGPSPTAQPVPGSLCGHVSQPRRSRRLRPGSVAGWPRSALHKSCRRRRISQKQLENATLLHRSSLFQPLLGGLLHVHLFCGSGVEKSIRYNRGVNPRQPEAVQHGRRSSAVSPQRLKVALYHYAVAIGTIAIVTFAYRRLPDVNPTTVALTFLLIVLLVASRWGLTIATTT